MKKQTPESFWAKVKIGKRNECWPWQGYITSRGYGNVGWNGHEIRAHRIAAWLSGIVKSPFAPRSFKRGRTFVLHTCDNPRCCNPHHLWIGTHQQNVRDSVQKGRARRACGEQHGRHKLTTVQVRAIRKRYAMGTVSQTQLGMVYGVSHDMIYRIVRNRNWTHT